MQFRPEVAHLLATVQLNDQQSEILRIAVELEEAKTPYERMAPYADLVKIDNEIPGLGLHNVSEKSEHGCYTGVYQLAHRPIFRGIQYVGSHLNRAEPEWLARTIVTESCYHIESSLKHQLDIDNNLSIGRILGLRKAQGMKGDLKNILQYLNKSVYNNSKHTIETIRLDSHMFSVADAIAIYLVCRVLGAWILRDAGITTRRGTPVF